MKPGNKKTATKKPVKGKASAPAKKPAKQPAKPAKTAVTAKKPVAKKVVATKAVAKKAAAPKVVAKKAAVKPAAKKVTKVALKSPAKTPTKASAKASAKSLTKTAVKPAAKAAAKKPAAKAPVKASAKSVTKVVAKAALKTAPKAAVKKSAAKVATKTAPKTAPKTAAKAVAKPAAKPAAKPVAKPAAKATPAKPEAKAAAKPAAKAEVKAPEPPVKKPGKVITKMPEGKTGRKRPSNKPIAPSMTEAEMAPSHDPGAVKATFITDQKPAMNMPSYVPVKKDPKRVNNWKTVELAQLTDADMLAMPEGEYMNKVQMAYFRAKLVQLKQDILANAGETTEHLREDTVVVPDPADRATIEEEHALELRTRDRERKLLKKIEQSIMRIDADDYGFCDETGEAIGVGRLLARPTATLSLEAQQRRELKQKMFGD